MSRLRSLFGGGRSEVEKAARKAKTALKRADRQAWLDGLRRDSAEREARNAASKDHLVRDAVAPHLADGEEVVYLARFKQGEGIFTDYLAVTDRKLIAVTAVSATPSTQAIAFRAITSVSERPGHLQLTIDGRPRAFNYIEPKEQTAEIAAFISAHL